MSSRGIGVYNGFSSFSAQNTFMFTKGEFFGAVAISLIGGIAIGYSKAREVCMAAIAKAQTEYNIEREKEESEKEES